MKRFTETEKWRDPWFRSLSPVHKCFWQYLCDNCDHAGVVEIDWALVGFVIGQKVSVADLSAFSRQITILPTGKIWLRGFVQFQYGKLSADCKPHCKVFATLERHGISPEEAQAGNLNQADGDLKGIHTLSIGYLGTLEEEEEEEEEDKKRKNQSAEPLPFSSPEFADAWANWGKHRTEIRKPLKPTMRKAQLAELAAMGEARAIAAINHTIAKGWQGLREPEACAQQQGTLSGFAPRPSLGALQIELNKVRDEIADILHPGGCSGTVEPKGDKRVRYDALVARRQRIQAQIEQAA